MQLEQMSSAVWRLEPGPIDVHTHPRAFDALSNDRLMDINLGVEGKAGLSHYTRVALRCGIVAMIAMPNESVRLIDASEPVVREYYSGQQELTESIPYPIADRSRVLAFEALISQQSVIQTGLHFGLDPQTAFDDDEKTILASRRLRGHFYQAHDECLGLKVYLAETTGGNNIGVGHGARVAQLWYEQNPDKPITYHVEGGDVARLLGDIAALPKGKDIPIHIAHVSSKQELQAVIEAKENHMNVTCEVTPHHLVLDSSVRDEIGGFGCVKPELKTQEDIDYIWAHIDKVDMFASDCAPHRVSDKEAGTPGFSNHTFMLPLLIGAVKDCKLKNMQDIYDKLCINPRKRFNLPLEDDTEVRLSTTDPYLASATRYEELSGTHYGQNPLLKLQRRIHLVGGVAYARSVTSNYSRTTEEFHTSYRNLLRYKNLVS